MNGRIARLLELMAGNWQVEDVRSDDRTIEVLLARGPSRTSIVLDEQDAWDVLFADGLETRGRPAARRDAVLLRP